MDLQRHNAGRNHWYTMDGEKIPGVTGILNDGMPKQLTKWAARCAADDAVNRWDELSGWQPSARLRYLEGAPGRALGEAAQRGTDIHQLAWGLITGEAVEVPAEYEGPVGAVVRLMDWLGMRPVLREVPVFHLAHRWGGTIDLLADLSDGERWLLDWKTGRSVFDSAALQLAAYNHASVYVDEAGAQREWIPAQRLGVVHITTDDAQLLPVAVDQEEAYTAFRYAQQVAKWTGRARAAWSDGTPWPFAPAHRPAA